MTATSPWPDVRALDTPTPEAVWGEALGPHLLENLGTVTRHIISREVKSAGYARERGKTPPFGRLAGWID